MRPLRIALAQCRQTAALVVNGATIFRFLDQAAQAGAQIVCFPETQTVGYRVDIATPETPVEPERLDDLHHRVARRCGELGLACILGTETPLESAPRRGKPYRSDPMIVITRIPTHRNDGSIISQRERRGILTIHSEVREGGEIIDLG